MNEDPDNPLAAPEPTHTIAEVDFGRIDAESDSKLRNYFVDTGVLTRIASGERQFVIGRKGSGKTALYQQAETALSGTTVVRLEFSEYAWEKHKAIKELGLPPENAYTASWLFTFLLSMCTKWRASSDSAISKAADEAYTRIYGKEHAGLLDLLIDKLRRIRKLDLPNVGDLGGAVSSSTTFRMAPSSLVRLMFGTSSYHSWPKRSTLNYLSLCWLIASMTAGTQAAILKICLQGPSRLPAP